MNSSERQLNAGLVLAAWTAFGFLVVLGLAWTIVLRDFGGPLLLALAVLCGTFAIVWRERHEGRHAGQEQRQEGEQDE